jgi:hypothetical protein
MAWTPLDAASEPEHNPDVIEAIETVRIVLRSLNLTYLDPTEVIVDANPDYRAALFRFPHSADPETYIELRQGDGYSYLKSPLGEYHGSIPDGEFAEFLEAVLTGGLTQTRRLRGQAPVAERLQLLARDGRWKELARRVHWLALWRLAVPTSHERFERYSLSFDRLPGVARTD